jgi:hypothetical protein
MPRFTIRPLDEPQPVDHRRAFPLALIAAAALAAAGCGSTGTKPAAQDTQAGPTPATTTTVTTTPAAAAPQKFMSQRYRFRVTVARDWSEQDALDAWNGKKLEGIGSSAFANFTDPTGRTLVAAAARVAKGTRLAEWRAAMVRAAPDVCSESSSAARTTLGGDPALAWTAACSDGYHVNKIAALHAGRGYMILLPSPTANDDAKDRRIFESIRRSFRFTPQ